MVDDGEPAMTQAEGRVWGDGEARAGVRGPG
jgi:hypothetical protein